MYLSELAKNYCELRALSPETVRTYLACARAVGNPHLSDMTTQWLNTVCESLPSPVTWNVKLARFRTLVRFAIELGYPGADHPVFKIQRKSRLVHAQKTLPDQYMFAHEYVKDWNARTYQPSWLWSTLIDFLYFTGVRRRQVCEIIWSDLDLKRGTLLLRAAGSKNKSERTVPIHPELCARLVRYRAVVRSICEIKHDQALFSWRCIWPDALDDAITPYRLSKFFELLKTRTKSRSAHTNTGITLRQRWQER
jgi:integrase